jgi:hypothetical protein
VGFGGFSGVDSAALPFLCRGGHAFTPKNLGPDQRVPVIARATSERLA